MSADPVPSDELLVHALGDAETAQAVIAADSEVAPPGESKPGTRTTEFWLTLLFNLAAVIELVADPFGISDKWVLLASALVTALYNTSRGFAKSGVPYVSERSAGL